MKKIAVTVSLVALAACVRTNAALIDPAVHLAPTCSDAVKLYTSADQVQRLGLQAGQPVQINVPGDVGDQPWGVYFRYLDATGQLLDGRSEIFTDGRLAYTLHPFHDDDQLVYVEVQSGFVLMAGATSGIDFAASQGWLLLIDPIQPSPAAAQ